jgi:hypothetical protein
VPSKEELSEQLGLTTKLAAQVERMAAAAEKLEGSYSAQQQTLTQIAQALGQLNVQGSVQGIQALNTALKDFTGKLDESGKASESTFKKLGKKLDETGKNFAGKFPKSVAVGTAALTGFYQGLKNTVALTKGVGGFISSFVSGIGSITASILAIPLKIFSGLIDMAAQGAGGSNELMQALENLRKEFGAFYGPTNKAIIDTTKSMTGFKDTGLSTWRVFGNMAQRLEYIQKLANEMGRSFLLLRKEMEENGGAILAYQKGLGLSGEAMKAVSLKSAALGKTSGSTLKDMVKFSYELGDAFGLDAKVISRDMGDAMKDMGHFGSTSTKVLAESVAQAHRLGLEFKDITGTLDTFQSFDDAAEHAAKLQQAFGANIDVMGMMKASAEGDVGKSLELLRKGFKQAGIDGAHLNAVQRKLIKDNTGLTDEAINNAFAMKNQSKTLADVKKASGAAEKKTLSQAEAMQKLADAIERMVQSGGGLEGGFWKMFVKGIGQGIMSSKEFVGIMYKIRIALRQVFMIGVQLGRALVEIVPGLKDIGVALNKLFDPKKITSLFDGVRKVVEKFFGKGDDPKHPVKGSIPALVAGLKDTFKNFFNAEGAGAKQLLDGFKKFFRFAAKFAAEGIKFVAKSLAEGFRSITNMIQGKEPIPGVGAVGGAAAGGLGFMKEILTPIVAALKEAWQVMAPALWDLVKTLGEKFVEMLKKHKDAIAGAAKPVLGGLAALLFGPAFGRAALGALTSTLLKIVVPGLLSGAGKLLGGLVGKAAKVEEAAQAATGGAKGMQQVSAVTKESDAAIKNGKGWGIKDAVALGAKLVAIATALAIGGVEMALAIVAMKKIMGDMGPKDVVAPLMVLGAMVVAAIPMAAALRIVSKAGSVKDMLLGGLVLSTAVGIVGLVGAGLSYVMKKAATPAELSAAGDMMLKMSLTFLAMVPLIAAAAVIGALVTGPQAIVLGLAAAGFGVLVAAVGGMATVAMGIVKELNEMQVTPDFQRKIDAFLKIMQSIQAFADTIVKVIGLMTPSFTELLSGKAESFSDKVTAARGLINDMIGNKGGGKGIIGLVETVLDSVKKLQLGQGIAEKAQVFSSIMTAVSQAMTAMTPPPEFFEAGSSFLVQLSGGKPFTDLATDVNYYAMKMRDGIMTMILGDKGGKGGIIDIINQLKAIPFSEEEAKQATVAGQLISAISSVMKNIIPSGDTMKAFTSTVNTGLINVGSFNLLGGKVEKLDTDAMAKTMGLLGDKLSTLLPMLTTGVLKGVLDQTKGLDASQLEGLKAGAEVLKASVDATRAIGDNLKGGGDVPVINTASLGDMTKTLVAGFGVVSDVQKQLGPINPASMASFGNNMTALADAIKGGEGGKGGVVGALTAISAMIEQANALNDALASSDNIVSVKARLEKVAQAVGLGGKTSYTVNPSKAVQITLNVEVTMDVGEVEKVMILRKQSIIADRIDFATVRDPNGKLSAPLTSYTPAGPPAIPASAGKS